MTHGDQDPSPSAWTCARDASAHEDVDDTETAAVVGGGHAFGKMHAACPVDQPLNPQARSLRNNQSPKTRKSSRRLRGMRHSKCESQTIKPEPQRVEKIDEMRLLNMFKVPEIGFGRSSSRSQQWRLNSWRTM